MHLKITKHIFLGATVAFFITSALASQGAVTLTVSPNTGGTGIMIEASGTIDTSTFTWFADSSGFGASAYQVDVFQAAAPGFFEQYIINEGQYNGAASNIFYDSVTSTDLGIIVRSDTLAFFGPSFLNDDLPPTELLFRVGFTLIDLDGALSNYTDGFVLWDSNGVTAGGEQVVFSVVPEPSSALLLGLGGLGLAVRRRRAKLVGMPRLFVL